MIKIACAGDNCVDYYDNIGESFPGGNPVNVSVYVRRLGGQSAYLARWGRMILENRCAPRCKRRA